MSGGPLFPTSAYPVTSARVFAGFHVGDGSNSKQDEGLRVTKSLDADAIWRLRWSNVPATLPSGTLKLRLRALSRNATGGSQVAKVNPKWASVAVGEDPSSATLQAEGTTTVTWAASSADNDKYKDTDITLDADTLVGGEILAMDLTFETSGWTLAIDSTWIPMLVWV